MQRTVILAVAAAAAAAAPAFGSSLTSVGVLDTSSPATTYSELRALSSDGTYAVGTSTTAIGTNVPVIWSAADGLVQLPNPSGKNSIAHGVAVGISANLGNIIISGLHEGYLTHRYYKAPLTSLASGAWADSATAAGLPTSDLRGGTANDLRNQTAGDGRWYTGAQRANGRVARLRGDPFIGWDGTSSMTGNSVSGYGVVVGRYTGVNPSTARWDSPQSDTGDVPGGTGSRADGFGLSSSFGISTTTNFEVQWICGQVANYFTNGSTFMLQAFRWNRNDVEMTPLGSLAPAGGGDAANNSSVAYTVADNGVTAGRSYFGAAGATPAYEVATVWDTSGTWNTSGTPQSLQTLLEADGVDTSEWTLLSRIYAASDDGKVLAGYGIWAADGSTRGFVAVKTATAPVVMQITNIAVSAGTVTIDFTSSSGSDTTASFTVQHSGTADGTYTDTAATITGSAGAFQATLSTSGDMQFYRIRHL